MTSDDNNLIWLDLEMTGLDPDTDRIIEIATIVTDSDLNIVAEGPDLVIHQPNKILDAMNDWCIKQHGASGLTQRVKNSSITEEEAQAQTLEFIMQYVPKNKSPLCGNTVSMDRRFMYKYMPKLEAYFHYRHLDVSTLKILAQRWKPTIAKDFDKDSKHLALSDIKDSINELKYYRENLLQV